MSNAAFKVTRVLLNTLDTYTVPIVFLPGMMGSRLRITLDGETRNWDPDSDASMLFGWVNQSLAERTEVLKKGTPSFYDHSFTYTLKKFKDPAHQNGFPEVMGDAYLPFLEKMAGHDEGQEFYGSTRCPIYALGYDWRKSIKDCAAEVQPRIEKILAERKADKVVIVTHSMGGLVARYLSKNGFEGKIAGMVHVAQPVDGAPLVYRRFIRGADDIPENEKNREEKMQLFGFSGWAFAAQASALPGLCEMLPNDKYQYQETPESKRGPWRGNFKKDVAIKPDPSAWKDYAKTGNPGVVPAFDKNTIGQSFTKAQWKTIQADLVKSLTAAATVTGTIAYPLGRYAHPTTATVANAAHHETIGGVDWYTNPDGEGTANHLAAGDSTVPLSSGSILSVQRAGKPLPDPFHEKKWRMVVESSSSHQDILKDAAVQDLVAEAVKTIVQLAVKK